LSGVPGVGKKVAKKIVDHFHPTGSRK